MRSLHRRAARRAPAVTIGVAMTVSGGHAQGGEDVILEDKQHSPIGRLRDHHDRSFCL